MWHKKEHKQQAKDCEAKQIQELWGDSRGLKSRRSYSTRASINKHSQNKMLFCQVIPEQDTIEAYVRPSHGRETKAWTHREQK